jgi:hypothetical protein
MLTVWGLVHSTIAEYPSWLSSREMGILTVPWSETGEKNFLLGEMSENEKIGEKLPYVFILGCGGLTIP